ncbi:MAG: glutamate-5-semialdehyde dehydrogenase [Vibrionaceae bacterium]
MNLEQMGQAAKIAAAELANTSTKQKNLALTLIADELLNHAPAILAANAQDLAAAKAANLDLAMQDRLRLSEKSLQAMAEDIRHVVTLADPIGSEFDTRVLENGLTLGKRREPIGVIGVIYEARPNVTIDIAALCLKTGNAAILRGGKEMYHSNQALMSVIHAALEKANLAPTCIQLIANPDRSLVAQLLRLDNYIDMIIPRGGEALHKMCKENSTIPVITGGFGVSHIFVDKSADLEKAIPLIINAKTQRPSACNALDTLLIHKDVASTLLEKLLPQLQIHNVALVATPKAWPLVRDAANARQADTDKFTTEWLSLTLAVDLVDDVHGALAHMRACNANHSDAILTNDRNAAQTFIRGAGSAAVYVNASTRFTDGGQFGLGAEVAVSTQKLHARGPMGLEELTTYKWVGQGDYLLRS